MRIQEIFPDGHYIGDSEYLIKCIFCGDHQSHNHLYVNIKKGVFVCQLCGERGNIRRLFEAAGEDVRTIEPEKIDVKKRELIDFGKFPSVLGSVNMVDKWAMLYLEERGITKKEIVQYDIRYAYWGKYENRVIFPVYEKGQVVCWAARVLFNDILPKYLYPSRGESLRTASEVLFPAFAGWAEYNILVEGIFDAIGLARKIPNVLYKPMALLGKQLSWFQRKLLLDAGNDKIYIMLDADAREDILRVAKDLHGWGSEVFMCFLENGDPASASKDEVDKAINEAIKYSFDANLTKRWQNV